MPRPRPGSAASEPFLAAVAQLAQAPMRAEITVEEIPAPTRLAPYAVALAGEVAGADGAELAAGRLVVLHDPQGQEAWRGHTRLVAYARAEVETDIGEDPLLGAVGWSWLVDAIASRGAEFVAAGGTVTSSASQRFGALSDVPGAADDIADLDPAAGAALHPVVTEVELRASWTAVAHPDDALDLVPHVLAWTDLLATVAGLPPLPPGVATLPAQRRPGR